MDLEIFENAQKLIQKDYVDQVIQFLLEKQDTVTTNKTFIKVYEVVLHQCDNLDAGGKLYVFFQSIMKSWIADHALPALKEQQQRGNLLEAFDTQWYKYNTLCKLMERLFDYLNRYYLRNQGLKTLGQACMDIWVSKMYEVIKEPLLAKVLETFHKDRNGDIIDKQLITKVVQTYVLMGLANAQPARDTNKFFWQGSKNLKFYETEFEQHFLTQSREEYEIFAKKWIANCTAPSYLKLADQAFEHEEGYCQRILQPETRAKLMKRVESELISRRNKDILNKETGCKYMIQNQRLEELRLLYKCFSREDSNLGEIIHCLCEFIEEYGGRIVKDQTLLQNPIDFSTKLLQFKKEIDGLISNCFNNNLRFEKGRDNSFQNFMNTTEQTPAYLANFTDNELKGGIQGMSNEDVEERLTQITRLFCCLHSRDTYVQAYQGYLANRLLNKQVTSQEAEELMLSKLRMELGINAVHKMSQMFKDMQISKDMLAEFQKNAANSTVGAEINTIQVLTSGNWPIEDIIKVEAIPPALTDMMAKFTRYYSNKFNNRRLSWLPQFGTVELTPTFTERKGYNLITNVVQAIVLNMFNEKREFTFQEIADRTKIPREQLVQGLLIMCNPKMLLLKKQIKVPKFDKPDEKIELNMQWSSKNILVKLAPSNSKAQANKMADEQSKNLQKGVDKERCAVMDAVIVKIMKTNKDTAVKHVDLTKRTIEMIQQFKAQPQMIKARIEDLLVKNYMRRDENDRSKYWYIA